MKNYNVEPYYDDFNPDNNYHRILFKPGVAVQARELTQLQTQIQNQITKFASAIYSQNTPISGGKVTYNNVNVAWLKLNSIFEGVSIDVNRFLNKVITDSSGTIEARVITVAEETGNINFPGDPPTLIVTYLSGANFTDGMTVYIKNGLLSSSPAATTIGIPNSDGVTCRGRSSTASITEGVFYVLNGYNEIANLDGTTTKYAIGNFVTVKPQTVIMEKYKNIPTMRVGLNIVEKTVSSSDDVTLLDPASGSSNYQAPGADRYKIELILETRPIELGNDDNFIELIRVENGKIQKRTDTTVYSAIDDYLAKRTYDTNGDFIVSDFSLTPTSNTANAASYKMDIGPGVAYIKGYRVEAQGEISLSIDSPRARTTESATNNPVYIDYGNFLYVNTLKGLFDTSTLQQFDLHCVPTANIYASNNNIYNSTKIGTATVRNLSFDRALNTEDSSTFVYKAFLTDISTNALNANVISATQQTITLENPNRKFSNVANAYAGITLSVDSGSSFGDIREITEYDPTTCTFTVNKRFSIPPDTTSKISLKYGIHDADSLANTTISGLGNIQIKSKANVSTEGKVNNVLSGKTVLQDAGRPELIYEIGNRYVAGLSDASFSTTQVFRNKSFSNVSGVAQLQITLPIGSQSVMDFGGGTGTLSDSSIQQNYNIVCVGNPSATYAVGDIIPFTGNGRSISISSDKNTLTLTAGDTTNVPTNMAVSIIAKMNVTNGDDTTKIVRSKNLITGNTSNVWITGTSGTISNTFVDLIRGQVYIKNSDLVTPGQAQSLYVTDLKRIVKIIDTKGVNADATLAMLSNPTFDVTNNYILDNGQRDNTYEHATIRLRPGFAQPKGHILVIFDYYSHSGGDGYFSGMSYLNPLSTSPENYGSIPVYKSKDGKEYNLRDCLDFRPSRVNATANRLFETTGNPLTDDTGVFIPEYTTNFLCDYSYYLGRKDLLVLTKDSAFTIIEGVPGKNPILPVEPDGALVLAEITHDPYTAFIPSETPVGFLPNLSIQRRSHKRFTMKDIGGIENRVNNIEYYTSLSLLEQKASTLQVADSNGLNRFKNGILVDDFSSFSTLDSNNSDFNCSVDVLMKKMSASQQVTNYPLQSSVILNARNNLTAATLASLGFGYHKIEPNTNMFSLPFVSRNVINQRFATGVLNVNTYGQTFFNGNMTLTPPMDNWVDNKKQPDLLMVDPSMQLFLQSESLNVLNVGNWQQIPGTTFSTSSSSVGGGGTTISTQTYADFEQKTISGYWSKLPSSYVNDNGYITSVAVQPYIRAQDIVVRAEGLRTSTAMKTFFDGIRVDEHISMPSIIELESVSGRFQTGDLLGYLNSGNWVLVGRVFDVYNYTGTNRTRLYAFVSDVAMTTRTISRLQNAQFNSAGQYSSTTASGTPKSGTINGVTMHTSGFIANTNNGTTTSISGGGTITTNVTQITLSPLSSNTAEFYTGSDISITTNNGSEVRRFNAVITAYNPTTKVATLSTAINVTRGFNSTRGVSLQSSYRIRGTAENYVKSLATGKAPKICTSEGGVLTCTFSIPAGTFQNGQRVFKVDNRYTDDIETTASSYASATFTASGLSTTSQALNFAPSIDSARNTFVSTAFIDNRLIAQSSQFIPDPPPPPDPGGGGDGGGDGGGGGDPLAQTFSVDKNNFPNGLFLRSVRVYFKSKPTETNTPISLLLVGTLNGYPNGITLDNGIVTLTPDKINVSDNPHHLDPSTYTDFTFKVPVFISPDTLYAFILKSPGTDYTVYYAAIDSLAIPSTAKNLPTDATSQFTKVNQLPYMGNLFESQNALTWSTTQGRCMMFGIDQAYFDITQTPTIQFVVPENAPTRKSVINDVFKEIDGENLVNFDDNVSTGDILSDAYNMTTTDLIPTSTAINYRYNATIAATNQLIGERPVTPGRFGSPTLDNVLLDDGNGQRKLVANSSNSFILSASIYSNDRNVSPFISDDGLSLYNVVWNINNLPLTNNQITLVSGGANYNANATYAVVSNPSIIGGEPATVSLNVANGIINSVYVNYPGSGYLETPTITIVDSSGSGSNASVSLVSELSPNGGNAATRYVTKKVVLTPDNESGDLRVYLSAYKPQGTDVHVFYKILSRTDTQKFEDGYWQLMTPIQNQSYFSKTLNDVQEIEYAPGINNIANNRLSYTSTTGINYDSFIQFAVKVVLTTSDTTKIPYLTDIRAIALPDGTGI